MEEDETFEKRAERLKKISTEIGNYIKRDDKVQDNSDDEINNDDDLDDRLKKKKTHRWNENEKLINTNVVFVFIFLYSLIFGVFTFIFIPSILLKIIYIIAFVLIFITFSKDNMKKKHDNHKCAIPFLG